MAIELRYIHDHSRPRALLLTRNLDVSSFFASDLYHRAIISKWIEERQHCLSLSPPSQSSVLIDLLTIVPPPTLKAIDIDFVTLDYYIVLNLDVLLWKIAIDVNSPCGFYGAAAAVKRSFIFLLLPFVVIDPNPFTRSLGRSVVGPFFFFLEFDLSTTNEAIHGPWKWFHEGFSKTGEKAHSALPKGKVGYSF